MTRLCGQPANDARGDNLSLLLTDGDIRVIVVCYLKRVGPPFPLDRVAYLCNSRLLLLVIFTTTTRVPSFDSAITHSGRLLYGRQVYLLQERAIAWVPVQVL